MDPKIYHLIIFDLFLISCYLLWTYNNITSSSFQSLTQSGESKGQLRTRKLSHYYFLLGHLHPTHVSSSKILNVERNIAFVHIGKTGGTTAGCMIRMTQEKGEIRRNVCSRVKNATLDELKSHETQISKLVTQNYHVRKDNLNKFTSFLVTARHPIDRLISWFLYQHPLNDCENWEENYTESSAFKVFECYPELDKLVRNGLRMNGNSDCEKAAFDCVIGKDKGCEHMYHNYEWYLNGILNDPNKEIFVLRTENFWDDWESINNILGGSSEEIQKIEPVTHTKNRFTGEQKNYSVTNRTMSQEGLANACHVLCNEIQVYRQLLTRATNLNDNDRRLSIQKISETCPLEVNGCSRT